MRPDSIPTTRPATWEELVAAGQKLVSRSGDQVERWGMMIPSTGYPYWMFGALTMQNDQVLMNGDGNETYYDAPATQEALQFWRDLGAVHGVMPSGTIEWGTLRKNFLEARTAIMWHSTGNLTAVKKNAQFDFGVAMLPAKKRRGTPTGGGNFYIFKQTTPEERKAAMKLVRFLTQPERTAEWSIKTGYIGNPPGRVRHAGPAAVRGRLSPCRGGAGPARVSRPRSCPPTRPAACASFWTTRSRPC